MYTRTRLARTAAVLALACTSMAVAGAGAAAAQPQDQVGVGGVAGFPTPTGNGFDWAQRARDYDAYVYDWTDRGAYTTIMEDTTALNMDAGETTYKMPAYYGDSRVFGTAGDGQQEAVAQISSVVGASLVGIDKSDQAGRNYVDMLRTFYHPDLGVALNTPLHSPSAAGSKSIWYSSTANVLYYMLGDLYPDATDMTDIQRSIADSYYDMVVAVGGADADFTMQDYDFVTETKIAGRNEGGEAASAAAAILLWAYDKFGDDRYLTGAQWAMDALDRADRNLYYEILPVLAPYLAARLNAETGSEYDVSKLLQWLIQDSSTRGGWGTISGAWGGVDVSGLQGSRGDMGGYAFAMNSFSMPLLAATAKYDARYADAVGQWMASIDANARRFYADQMTADQQYYGSTFISDPAHVIAYEGIMHTGPAGIQARGDIPERSSSWGVGDDATSLGLYGSGWVGFMGAALSPTDAAGVVRTDLNALDFYSSSDYPTYLYYNPSSADATVTVAVDSASDLYDSVSDAMVATGVTGSTTITIPAGHSVVLVEVPAGAERADEGSTVTFDGVAVAWDRSPRRDLALDAVASATAGSAAAAVNDADDETSWVSTGTAAPSLELDLGGIHAVGEVGILWGPDSAASVAVMVSTDGSSWTEAASVTGGIGGAETVVFDPVDARYVRLDLADSSHPSEDAYEVLTATVRIGDLAQARPTTASSTANALNIADNATDGSSATRWESVASDPQWISVDLGSSQPIGAVDVSWEAAAGKDFRIEVSDDGAAWATAATVTDGAGGDQHVVLADDTSGRYVRLFGTARLTSWAYSLYSLEVTAVAGDTSAGVLHPIADAVAGEDVTVLGTGFAPDTDVAVSWQGTAHTTTLRASATGVISGLLSSPGVGTFLLSAVSADGAETQRSVTVAAGQVEEPTPPTVGELADSSDRQQRWISEPDSRIVLNPSRTQTNSARPNAANTLDTVFYADQRKKTDTMVVRNGFTAGEAAPEAVSIYDEGDTAPLVSEGFDEGADQRWPGTDNGASLVVGDDGGTVVLPSGTEWGSVGRAVVLDIDNDPILLVSVAQTTGTWALKIAPEGQGDILVQGDTDATGTFAYDLDALGFTSGAATVKVFAAQGGSATFRALSIHERPSVTDDFTDLGQWSTDVQSNNGATIEPASSGLGATVTSTSDAHFGAVARTVTVDLSATPVLTIAVGPLSEGSSWALKLTGADGAGDLATVQGDTSATGVFSYNLAALTGLSGEQTFGIKLFSTKTPTPTSATFTRLSLHASSDWVQTTSAHTNTWNPQSLDWTGTYGDAGTYTTRDVFVDADTVSRLVNPDGLTAGHPTLLGTFSGGVDWDPTDRVLTLAEDGYTRAVAFPAGADVAFFDNSTLASRGVSGASAPTSESTAWVAVLPRDAASAIGFGYVYGTSDEAATSAASSAAHGADATVVADALSARTSEWNAYLSTVPAVSDFTLHAVDAEGTTPEAIRALYYRAFVALKQTVVAPQPESGISHHQVATGKAATYNGGSARNRASASWDSLLGIEYLAYTEPDLAWDAFVGMMADVESDGGLNGESLPSRKAQTAWVLYNVTGDAATLAEVYPAIKAHMGWSSEHLAWNIASHFPGGGVSANDERDAEFVSSLAVDLEYAARIAEVLGVPADATDFLSIQADLIDNYREWFFMPDGRAVQYYWTSVPDASYEQRQGTVNYVGTGLHMPGLDDAEVDAVLARFDAEYDPSAQFAGIAADAVKAPDAQFLAYGLLESGQAAKAQVYLESVLRDVTRTHQFSEVYQAGSTGAEPISRGESPTTFGMAQVIDNLWIMNGFRSDEGSPTFVRLADAAGGVSGLTYLGRSLDVSISGSQIILGGDAASQPGVCDVIDAEEGVSMALTTSCAVLSLSSITVNAGDVLTLHAEKLPASSEARVELHSDPVLLATPTTSSTGTVDLTVTIPADTAPGEHSVVVMSGTVTGQASVTVMAADAGGGADGGGGATDGGGGSGGGGGATDSGAGTGQGALALTGAQSLSLAVIAVIALAMGAALRALARRRAARL